jgi:hypothetical protein
LPVASGEVASVEPQQVRSGEAAVPDIAVA